MAQDDAPTARDVGDALVEIHGEGGDEVLGLVGTLMEQNRRDAENLMSSLYEGEKRAHEETKERLERAYARLDLIEHRHEWLLGKVHTPFPVDED